MTLEYLKECSIGAHQAQILMKSPSTCREEHGRACQRCWEKHLRHEVEMRHDHSFRCMFCLVRMERADLERLARKGTVKRYDFLTTGAVGEKNRQCPDSCIPSRLDELQPKSTRWQPHDGERVFTCEDCGAQACVACDRPEHHGRSCGEFEAQVQHNAKHLADEAATAATISQMFAEGECAHCPACDAGYAKGSGCEYLQCAECKWRFCGECFAPWVGPRGEYAKGSLAHARGCRFRTEKPHDDHSYRKTDAAGGAGARAGDEERRTRSGKVLKTVGESDRAKKGGERRIRVGESTVA